MVKFELNDFRSLSTPLAKKKIKVILQLNLHESAAVICFYILGTTRDKKLSKFYQNFGAKRVSNISRSIDEKRCSMKGKCCVKQSYG